MATPKIKKESGEWGYIKAPCGTGIGTIPPTDLGGGENNIPELLFEEAFVNVAYIGQEIDLKGHKNFTVILRGLKGENAISIRSGVFRVGDKHWSIMYYSAFLAAKSTSYFYGAIAQDLIYIGNDIYKISYKNSATGMIPDGTFQGNGSAIPAVKESYLTRNGNAPPGNGEGIYLTFSESIEEVQLSVYGY